MPIKDLTDSVRLPRLGKIHLGIRHPEKGYPMKTDYFVFDKDHPVTPEAHRIFGTEPRLLRIYIPSEDDNVWCAQYYQSYDMTHGLVCRGDGDKALMMVDNKTEELAGPKSEQVSLVDIPCPGKECKHYQAKKCHERMSLRFLIPELPGLGVWQIDTGSINSILNVNSSASLIRSAFKRISLIPLELTLEPCQVNNPETGKKQTVYVLNLRTNVTIVQLAEQAREESRKLLVAPLEDYDPAELWDDIPSATAPDTVAATKTPEKPAPKSTPEATESPASPDVPPEPAKATQAKESKGKDKPSRDPATIKTKGQFQTACHEDFGLNSPADILAALRKACPEVTYNSMMDITDYGEAYQMIAK